MEKNRCSSCNKEIVNEKGVVRFKCPSCAKAEIVRCGHCREIGARYTCLKCDFSGPN